MRILFDHGTPAPLQSFLPGHTVRDATAQGWDTFKNGDLLTSLLQLSVALWLLVSLPAPALAQENSRVWAS